MPLHRTAYLQTELEASFIYEDTPDQARTTEDVKRDMQEPHPMDRLVCGDVGFGKTEIAIRAAFKAATDGKAGRDFWCRLLYSRSSIFQDL